MERCYFHHRLFRTAAADTEPYPMAPAIGAFSRVFSGAIFDESYDWHPEVQAHGFGLPDGRFLLATWRVEPETLTMGTTDERTLGQIDSAPVEGIAEQRGIRVIGGAVPRANYFEPDRIIARELILSMPPDSTIDMWGNQVDPEASFPLEESPRYLIFKRKPRGLSGRVVEGRAPSEPGYPENASSPGQISGGDFELPKRVSAPGDLIQDLRQLPVRQASRPSGSPPAPIHLQTNEEAVWMVPTNAPARARLVALVRVDENNGFRYTLRHEGEEMMLENWAMWPHRERSRGRNWVEMQGYLLSEIVELEPGQRLALGASQRDSRIYDLWLWPHP